MARTDDEFSGGFTFTSLITKGFLAPRSGGRTGHAVASAVTAAVRVVGGGHYYATNCGADAHVAFAAGLADLDQLAGQKFRPSRGHRQPGALEAFPRHLLLLGHLAKPRPRSGLRLREPRRLPRGLQPGEAQALLRSFRTLRDREVDRAPTRHDTEPELWAAVDALPPRQRQAIALRYVLGFTQHEVALAMGTSDGTAASTLAKARAHLADALGTTEELSHD